MTVEEPVFTPSEGVYDDDMMVVMSCSTDGASIYYTTDGTEPSRSSYLYKEPLKLRGDGAKLLLFARAFHADMNSSTEANAQFLIVYPGPVPPVLDLSPGTYSNDITGSELTISHAPSNFDAANRWIEKGLDVSIRYTTDGSQPDKSSPIYTPGTPFTVTGDGTKFVLNAVSYANGYKISDAVTGIYTIDYSYQVESPSINGAVPNDILTAQTIVRLQCTTAGASINYTTDGSTPTTASSLYNHAEGITIFPSGSTNDGESCTLRARAFFNGMKDSEVFEDTYVYQEERVSPPEITMTKLSNGSSFTNYRVVFSCSTPGAIIHYTEDQSVPDPVHNAANTNSVSDGYSLQRSYPFGSTWYISAVAEKNGIYSSIVSASSAHITEP